MDALKDYLYNTSFHGLRFLIEPGRHWFERLFWLGCILASWYICFILIMSSYDGYVNNSLSFGTETDYIDWNTSFFTVAVCENLNRAPVYRLGKRLYGEPHDFNLDEVLLEISYFKGDHYFTKSFCGGGGPKTLPCPKDGFKNISDSVRTDCNGIFHECIWRNATFPCCHYFQPLQTEKGLCFVINSLLTENQQRFYDMVSNKYTGPGFLQLQLKVPADVFILAPEEVPFMNANIHSIVTAKKGIIKTRIFTVTEITNGPMVPDVSIDQRRCRFKDENFLKFYKLYSYMGCVTECRGVRQEQLCGCSSHLIPGIEPAKQCNITGLLCLIDNFSRYSVMVNPWNKKGGLTCGCQPSCTEPEITLVAKQDSGDPEGRNVGIVELKMARLPSLRLKRTVVKGPLDLVVSMGGSAGLFVGASLLSFVELIYFCTIRPWWNYRQKKKAGHQPQHNQAMSNKLAILKSYTTS